MGAIRINKFGGMVPIVDQRLLPETAAAYSENVRPLGGNLRGLRPDTAVFTCQSAGTKRAYRIPNVVGQKPSLSFPNSTWMEFDEQYVDVLRTPVVDDSFDRFYWARPGDIPRYNTLARIQGGQTAFKLGVPAPNNQVQVVASNGLFSSVEGAGFSGFVLASGKGYGVPFDATKIMVVDPTAGTAVLDALGAGAMSGQAKWSGGVLAPNGKIYCIPYDAQDILIIDPATGTASRSALGATLTGTRKWVGGVLGANGKIYGIPYNATDILIIDPALETATRSAMGATLTGASKWAYGAVSSNKIYGAPYDSADILVIDTTTGAATRSAMGVTPSGMGAWAGAVTLGGRVYGIPFNAEHALVINPANDTATLDNFGINLNGASKWVGASIVGTRIFCVPHNSDDILIIETSGTDTASRKESTENLSPAAKWNGSFVSGGKVYCAPYGTTDILVIDSADDTSDRTVLGASLAGAEKWYGAARGSDGKIYGIPFGATDIAVLDPATGQVVRTKMGASLTGKQKWAGAVVGNNGKIYGIPYDAEDVLIIDPAAGTATRDDFGLTLTGNAKWVGAVVGADGKIYCIPYNSTDLLIINTAAGTAERSTLGSPVLTGSAKWIGGVLGANDKIYGIPYDSPDILVVDPAAASNKVTRSSMGASMTGVNKWHGGALGSDNKIYCIPYNASDILVITPSTANATRTTLGGTLAGQGKWAFAAVSGGKIYGMPVNADTVLAIDPAAQTADVSDMDVEDLGGDTKWLGAATNTANTHIYCIPHEAVNILDINRSAGTAVRSTFGAELSDFVVAATTEEITSVRAYLTTWVTAYGEEGPPGPPTVVNGVATDLWSLVLAPPEAADTAERNLEKVRIYRTITGETGVATYFLVDELPINTTRYIDESGDDDVSLESELESTTWVAPPTTLKGMVAMPNGIFAGWNKHNVYFSEPYRPHAWPAAYAVAVDDPIIGVGVFGQTLVVLTAGDAVLISGVNPSSMSQEKIPTEPCVSRATIVSNPEGVYYASPNGLIFISSGSVKNITEDLVDREVWLRDVDPYKLLAARYQTGYLALEGPRAGAGSGIYIDKGMVGFNWMKDARAIQNVWVDDWTGDVLVLYDGGSGLKVHRLDPSDGVAFNPFTWRSKLFQLPKTQNLGVGKVDFTVPAGTPAQSPAADHTLVQTLDSDQYALLRVYADGVHVATREIRTSGDPFRLPSGFKAEFWQFEVVSRVIIHSLELATTARGLAGV